MGSVDDLHLAGFGAAQKIAVTQKEIEMTNNVGRLDRVLRILVGIALLAMVFIGPKTMWGLIGILPLATGLFQLCPLYAIFGLNTCGSDT